MRFGLPQPVGRGADVLFGGVQRYTGYSCSGTITYILQGGVYGISRLYVVIGFRYHGLTSQLGVDDGTPNDTA